MACGTPWLIFESFEEKIRRFTLRLTFSTTGFTRLAMAQTKSAVHLSMLRHTAGEFAKPDD